MEPFVTPIQELQFYDKYSRWHPVHGRRETWQETTDRVIDFFTDQLHKRKLPLPNETWADLQNAMLNLEAMPSMRVIQMAGPTLERCNVGGYNCAYLPIDSWEAFSELLYILMQGTGAGFSVEVDHVDSLPRIKRQKGEKAKRHTIPDSTEGWCNALLVGLKTWAEGLDIEFNFDKIRPQGAVLKTKGGRASGPEPLRQLLLFVRDKILGSQGRRLNPIDAHDIACFCGQIVQVGGVRRAALISLSDLDDRDMRDAKQGQFWLHNVHRAMANNSAVYHERPKAAVFMEEWLSLLKSGTGERGIFNRGGLKTQLPTRRKKVKDYGVNPCQPAWATVLTPDGVRELRDVNVGDWLWSGSHWTKIAAKESAGEQQVWRYQTTRGFFVGTAAHNVISNGVKIRAGKASSIDISEGPLYDFRCHEAQDVLDGLVIGDGMVHQASGALVVLLIGKDDQDYLSSDIAPLLKKPRPGITEEAWEIETTISAQELPRLPKRGLPARFLLGDRQKVCGFLRGLYSANGSICGGRVTLKAASFEIIWKAQLMLSSLGIRSYYTTNKPRAVAFQNGPYVCKQSYDLNITGAGKLQFRNLIGFIQEAKQRRLDIACESAGSYKENTSDIVSVEDQGCAEVFNLTVEAEEHTYWTGGLLVANCGEIILRPRQFCNLSIAIARPNDTTESLARKVRLAAIFGTMQSLLTDFKYISDRWKENCEEERLLGVDITGQMDCSLLRPYPYAGPREELLTRLKAVAIETNQEYANLFGIPHSAAVTCVKPSGNSAQLFNCSSGLHPRYACHYIRRIRIGAYTPIAQLLTNAGVPFFPEVGQSIQSATVLVFEFPVAAPDGAPTRHDMSALAQLENWMAWKQFYTEHNPSATIYVTDEEWPAVGAWVYDHFDQIGGLSFLPRDGGMYELAPYEEITKEEYEKRVKAMPVIDFSKLSDYEKEDMTEVNREFACQGDRCEI